MANGKKKSITTVLFRNTVPEGSKVPSLKGSVEVDRDHVTDIDMSRDDLAIFVAKVQKEGKFVLPQGLKLDIAYWSTTSRKGTNMYSGSLSNPYVKPEEQDDQDVVSPEQKQQAEDAIEAFSRSLAAA